MREPIWRQGIVLCGLLLSLFLAAGGLVDEPFWNDEAWSLWAVRDTWSAMWQRLAADVHPPLYFVLLYGWTRLVGTTAWSVRLLSTLLGLIGLAGTYATGRRLGDHTAGLLALLWLGSHSFFLYYARETRMYTLLLALAVLATWAYLAWWERPSRRRTVAYACTLALLLATHYSGIFIIITHALHALTIRRLHAWLPAAALGLLIFAPWLPVVWQQMQAHPEGPLIIPHTTSWSSVRWLVTLFSGGLGAGWMLLLLYPLAHALFHRTHHPTRRPFTVHPLPITTYRLPITASQTLLALWLLVTPILMLAINAATGTFHAARYAIGALPAAALYTAYALRRLRGHRLQMVALAVLVGVNLFAYPRLWPPKTAWGVGVPHQVVQARLPGEATLLLISDPSGLEAYYDSVVSLRNQWTVDIAPGQYSLPEMETMIYRLPPQTAVWVMMPYNVGDTWLAMASLSRDRHISTRYHTANFLYYRFAPGPAPGLHFTFVETLGYAGTLFAGPGEATPGEEICMATAVTSLATLDGTLSYGVHMVDGKNRLIAQYDAGLGIHDAGSLIPLTACFTIPAGAAPGTYWLHLVVYNWANGQRLPLQEHDIPWGDFLVFDTLTVEP